MDSTHRFSHLTLLPPLFRPVPALSSPVTFLRRLVCRGFFFFFLPSSVASFPRRLVVLFCTSASLRARFQVCRQA